MGFRYRRSLRLSPNVRLHISGRGINSLSLGLLGLIVNVGRRGVRQTVGLPGTGLSYPGRSGGAGLLVGAMLAGAISIVMLAARGNRLVQFTLVVVLAAGTYAALNLEAPDGLPRPEAPTVAGQIAVAAAVPPAQAAPSSIVAASSLPHGRDHWRQDQLGVLSPGGDARSAPNAMRW